MSAGNIYPCGSGCLRCLVKSDSPIFKTLSDLFSPAEGRMGVSVTFLAILELLRESLIEVVQAEAYSPIHVRAAGPVRVAPDRTSRQD